MHWITFQHRNKYHSPLLLQQIPSSAPPQCKKQWIMRPRQHTASTMLLVFMVVVVATQDSVLGKFYFIVSHHIVISKHYIAFYNGYKFMRVLQAQGKARRRRRTAAIIWLVGFHVRNVHFKYTFDYFSLCIALWLI